MDPTLNTFIVSLHILAAFILVGHILFWMTGLGSFTGHMDPPANERMLRVIMRSSSWIAWGCLCVLIVTGILLLTNWHVTLQRVSSGQLFRTRFGQLIAAKVLGAVLILIGLFFAGPGTSKLWRFNLLVAIIVIVLSLLVVR